MIFMLSASSIFLCLSIKLMWEGCRGIALLKARVEGGGRGRGRKGEGRRDDGRGGEGQ